MKELKPAKFDKFYKNKTEERFANVARSNGWKVTKRGYPDFICYRGEEIILVEVKQRETHRLSKSQWMLMNFLKKHGIKCYRWSPERDWMTVGHSLNGEP